MKLAVAGLLPDDYRKIDSGFLRQLSDDGFKAVGCYEEPLVELGAEGRKEFKAKLDDFGLGVHSWFVVTDTHIRPDHPDRSRDVDRFRLSAEMAHELDAESVGTSPGSFDPRFRWAGHPDNLKHEGRELMADSMREICPFYEDADVKLGLEFGSASVVISPQQALWVLNAVQSPILGVYADPVNQAHSYDSLFNSGEIINQLFDYLGPYILCYHARDAWVIPGYEMHIRAGAAGKGVMDFRTFFKRAKALNPSLSLLIEHTPVEEIREARDYVRKIAEEVGLQIE
ncbi:MAG: sugar phosphate isomerase/epimerase [Rhodospirillaceae bacterium]|jgi:sugar phosphate isomerase/epimerase|nr:sugar phosphate isomerase/epimerase [Rhodospirillaceae bacterium]MBT6119031.1 sugar phosphate isomerase/epimerase [Rhodospirillaceae bacterium]